MATTYTKSLGTDFSGYIDSTLFSTEVENSSIVPILQGIDVNGDVVDITFDSGLSVGEQTSLDNLISSHSFLMECCKETVFITITTNDSPYRLGIHSIDCDTSGGDITINLLKAGKVKNSYYAIKKQHASNTITIIPDGSELIDGQANKILTTNGQTALLKSDGTNWSLESDIHISSFENFKNKIVTQEKGEIIVNNGIENIGLNKGTDNHSLIADSTTSTGIKWAQIDHTNLSNVGTNTHSQIDTHIASTSNPHTVTKAQVGLGDVSNIKHNTSATSNPTSTDDTNSSYSVGSIWINISTDKGYICTDATSSAAVWIEITRNGQPTISYNESEHDSSTTSTTYTNKVSLTFTANSSDYLIQWYGEIKSTDVTTLVKVRVELDNTTSICEIDQNPDTDGGVGYGSISGMKKMTLTTGSRTIDLDYCSSNSGLGVNIRKARISATEIV